MTDEAKRASQEKRKETRDTLVANTRARTQAINKAVEIADRALKRDDLTPEQMIDLVKMLADMGR